MSIKDIKNVTLGICEGKTIFINFYIIYTSFRQLNSSLVILKHFCRYSNGRLFGALGRKSNAYRVGYGKIVLYSLGVLANLKEKLCSLAGAPR